MLGGDSQDDVTQRTATDATPADVQRVESSYEALNRGDIDATVAVLHDDASWVEHSDLPEAGAYAGVATIRAFLEHFLESWDEFHQTIEDKVVRGHCALLFIHLEARGKGSGIEVEQRYAVVYEVEEDRIVRMTIYLDETEALEAAQRQD